MGLKTKDEGVKAIRAQAEDVAFKLVQDGLVSGDPKLSALCERLQPYKGMLSGKSLEEAKVRTMLRNGLRAVRFKPDPSASREDEVVRMLNGLADKLKGMAKMYGFFS